MSFELVSDVLRSAAVELQAMMVTTNPHDHIVKPVGFQSDESELLSRKCTIQPAVQVL